MKVHAGALLAGLSARILSVDAASERTGIPKQTLYGLLGRADRRDDLGYVTIDNATARKLRELFESVPPLLTPVIPPQGPPERRAVPVDQTTAWEDMPGMRERLAAKAERDREQQRLDPRAQAPESP